MKIIKAKSPAKLNLALEVIKKLTNGFHEIRTVMLKSENLFDELKFIFDEKKAGIKITCNNSAVPIDEKNICWKIAEQFFQKTGTCVGLEIQINKNIPLASGMGGGSSNGATVLLAINRHFGDILTEKELITLAAKVGKDIPFFISKTRAASITGMGEKIRPLKNFPRLAILVINPKGEIPTPWAYGELDQTLLFMNDIERKNISQELIKNKSAIKKMSCYLYNDFSIVAKNKYPIIEALEKATLSFGAIGASITGKGPTVFGIFQNKESALEARKILKKYHPQFFIELA
jgi:4-diphosphocytidyl-2-C-methyl-D-erythritol kinase